MECDNWISFYALLILPRFICQAEVYILIFLSPFITDNCGVFAALRVSQVRVGLIGGVLSSIYNMSVGVFFWEGQLQVAKVVE